MNRLIRCNSTHFDRPRGRRPLRVLARWATLAVTSLTLATTLAVAAVGQEAETAAKKAKMPELPFVPGKNWAKLTRNHEVWMDIKARQVLVGGRICLRAGPLEMFACPVRTKEHESIVAVNAPARYVHAGLVACGARPGPPVQFQPEYKPAEGTEIEVIAIWKDAQGKEQRIKAQEWVKNTKTEKALKYPWVFAGSGFWKDEQAGEQFYYGDGGEFICVSNFSTATLDLPVASSDADATLLFTAFTEKIPPRGTRVYLLLTPQLKSKTKPKKEVSGGKEEKTDPKTTDAKKTDAKKTDDPKAGKKKEPGKKKEAADGS